MRPEPQNAEAQEMAEASAKQSGKAQESSTTENVEEEDEAPVSVLDSMASGPSLQKSVEDVDGFMDAIKTGYQSDPMFSKVIQAPSQ